MNLKFIKNRAGAIAQALLPLLVFILAGLTAKGQTVVATYSSGDIPALRATTPTNTTTSTCPGILSISIPTGNWVTGMSVTYKMTSGNNSIMAEQRSYMYSPTLALGEATVTSGTGGSGTYTYNRNPTFANGASGTFNVELRAFRTYGNTGCGTDYNKVDNNTWVLTVSYAPIPSATCFAVTGLAASGVTHNAANLAWNAPASGNAPSGYLYELRTSGAAGSGATGLVSSGTVTTGTTLALSGLPGATAYTAYVRSDCGGGDLSPWSNVAFTTTTTPCSAQPAAGTITGPLGSYAATNFTLGLTGNSNPAGLTGLTFQWQRSATGLAGSWTNVPSGTGVTVTTNQTVSNYYRAYVVCTAASLSDTTPVKLIRNYCKPTYSNTTANYRIGNVTFGTINNTTADNSVNDFSNLSNNVFAGVANNITTTTYGYTGSATAADLNNDGDFADTDEILFTGVYIGASAPETNTYAITIPAWVPTGSYRLRVYSWGGNSGGGALPCGAGGSGTYGSFRDYTINVTNNITCAVPTALATAATTYSGTNVSWTGTASNYQVSYGTQGTPADNGTLMAPQSATTATISGLNPSTNYSVYVRAICSNTPGDTSFWVGPVNFTTPCAAPAITVGAAADGAAPTQISACGDNDATITLKITTPIAYAGNYDVAYTKNGVAQTLTNQTPVNAGATGYLTMSALSAGVYDNFKLTQTGQLCSSTVLVSPVTIDAYTVSGLPANNATTSGTQPAGSNIQYATASCEPVVKITATSGNLGTVTATVNVSAAATFNGSPYVGRYYDIAVTQANGGTITLYFTDAEIAAYNTLVNGMGNIIFPAIGPNGENLRITAFHSAPGGGGAGPFGYSTTNTEVVNITGIVHNTTAGRWEVTCTTSGFSGFFAYTNDAGAPLAIKLADISAANHGTVNLVNWETRTEATGDRFDVARSIDGRNFTVMATVNAKGAASQYTYTDKKPYEGVTFYRLQLVDKDGRKNYSKTVTAVMKAAGFSLNAFPNPVNNELTVKVNGGISGKGQLELTDAVGRIVSRYALDDSGILKIPMTNLVNGIYLLKYEDGSNKRTLKINKH